jgi:2-keto-4-pentenoate hydratase/2-oxohepta-3-ene-1,7-dioic acid hydratase in catechol pathway
MRLVRYEAAGRRDVGILVDDEIFSLSAIEVALGREPLVDSDRPPRDALIDWMWRHQNVDREAVQKEVLDQVASGSIPTVALGDARLLAPVHTPQKTFGQGNFREHFLELLNSGRYPVNVANGLQASTGPKSYLASAGSITGPYDDIPYPAGTEEFDYEVELAVVMGWTILDASEAEVEQAILGVTVANDLTAREVQREEAATGLINRSKNLDGMLPLGPWIETDWQPCLSGDMSVKVNGEQRQLYSLTKMDNPMPYLISYFTKNMTFLPGDIVLSGTCPGPAAFQPNFAELLLKPGDVVETSISTIGSMQNRIV